MCDNKLLLILHKPYCGGLYTRGVVQVDAHRGRGGHSELTRVNKPPSANNGMSCFVYAQGNSTE